MSLAENKILSNISKLSNRHSKKYFELLSEEETQKTAGRCKDYGFTNSEMFFAKKGKILEHIIYED